ncbi:MAG: AI-2E family transporter [Magnetococcales bacterium]|nr:AI-2E family transporter [Magnetococcales bacterium]
MTMTLVLTVSGLVIVFFGDALAPFITSLVVAYLLEGMVRGLINFKIPRSISVMVVFGLFLIMLIVLLFVLTPLLAQQLTRLAGEIPSIIETLKAMIHRLVDVSSGVINPQLVQDMMITLVESSQDMAANSVSVVLKSLPGLLSLAVYLVLVPFLVFFFLWDKAPLMNNVNRFLPKDRAMLNKVLSDADKGVGGYIRGKFWEMLILAVATYLVFSFMGVRYAFLLSLLTGLSVLIPFLGIATVALPVVILCIFQWGFTFEAAKPIIAWGVINMIDGSVLTPLILGETVKVHPTMIMLAILMFGTIWGILGVFFAVPLAVLIKSIFEAILPEEPVGSESVS